MSKYGKDYPTLGSLARTKKNEKIKAIAMNQYILKALRIYYNPSMFTSQERDQNRKHAELAAELAASNLVNIDRVSLGHEAIPAASEEARASELKARLKASEEAIAARIASKASYDAVTYGIEHKNDTLNLLVARLDLYFKVTREDRQRYIKEVERLR
jgi:hypothetical protein